MTIRNHVLALIAATAFLASTALTGAAQDQPGTTASVAVTSSEATNYLAVRISGGTFSPVQFSFADQTTTGNLTVSVTDTRGTNTGWNVNLFATNFSPVNIPGASQIPIGNLALTPGAPTAVTGACGTVTTAAGQQVRTAAPVNPSGNGIWLAPAQSGSGCFDLALAGALRVPGGTLVGTYTSTVTVSITAAAP